jgi:hypothetical protein
VSDLRPHADADLEPRAGQGAGDASPQPRPTFLRVRRAPRYGPFVATGAVLGLVLAVVVTVVAGRSGTPTSQTVGGLAPTYSTAQVLGYLALFLVAAGGALGAVAALLVERRRRR